MKHNKDINKNKMFENVYLERKNNSNASLRGLKQITLLKLSKCDNNIFYNFVIFFS